MIGRQRRKNRFTIIPLIGQQPEIAALVRIERAGHRQQRAHARLAGRAHFLWRQAQRLRQQIAPPEGVLRFGKASTRGIRQPAPVLIVTIAGGDQLLRLAGRSFR